MTRNQAKREGIILCCEMTDKDYCYPGLQAEITKTKAGSSAAVLLASNNLFIKPSLEDFLVPRDDCRTLTQRD